MTRATVIVACADLMTTSRFQTAGADVDLVCTRSIDDAVAAVAAHVADDRLVVMVDLATCGEVAARVREAHGDAIIIVGFAPHVQEGLLAVGRETCTRVLPRGSVVKRFAAVITESLVPGI